MLELTRVVWKKSFMNSDELDKVFGKWLQDKIESLHPRYSDPIDHQRMQKHFGLVKAPAEELYDRISNKYGVRPVIDFTLRDFVEDAIKFMEEQKK